MDETVFPVYFHASGDGYFPTILCVEGRVVVSLSGHVCLLDWGRRSLPPE
jgi:hypothetical protein